MDFSYNFDDDDFLKELEVAINPFIRDEITLEEYMELSLGFEAARTSRANEHADTPPKIELQEISPPKEPQEISRPKDPKEPQDAEKCFPTPVDNVKEWLKPYVPRIQPRTRNGHVTTS